MLSVSELYNNVIFETLIDILLDNIYLLKKKESILSEDLQDQIFQFLEKHNITYSTEIIKNTAIRGKIKDLGQDKKIIILYIPKQIEELNQKEYILLMLTILHEISHYFSYKNLPKTIPIKKKGKILGFSDVLDFDPVPFDPDFNNPKHLENLEKFLDYVFHVSERPNWATTIILSNFLKNGEYISLIDILNSNQQIIDKYLERKISLITINSYANGLHYDLKSFFEIQFATNLINKKIYYNKFYRFVSLCKKYEKRILKIGS